MRKEVTAKFTLTSDEIQEALYDVFVRKMREKGFQASFSPKEVKVDFNDYLEVTLTINQEDEL